MRSIVRKSLALGMSTRPSPASSRTPSQGAHVPRWRFSWMAILSLISVTRRIQVDRRRSARSLPTTPKMGSSVYMCTTYSRVCRSALRIRLRISRHATAFGRSSGGARCSARSISSRIIERIASLNRWAILEEGDAPKPSRRSDTKKRRSPTGLGLCISSACRKTIPSFHQSSEAMASWLK